MNAVADVSNRTIAELVSLSGRTAVVTGGAQGLGKGIARRLAEAGAHVLIGDLNSRLAEATAAELGKGSSGKVIATVMDVSDSASVANVAKLVDSTFGGIDIWINNAGVFPSVPVSEMSDEQWDKVFAVNARGSFLGARAAVRSMSAHARGGVIVNVASLAGLRGIAPGLAAYVSSKHAVVGFTRALREEMRMKDSTVKLMLVSPGFVDTRMIERDSVVGFPDWLSWTLSQPDEVAGEIMRALRRGREEVTPTWNGRLMQELHKWMPRTTRRSAKVLLTRSLKDLVLRRYTVG
jgi:NAD(P)-dependent dehydrogenase (short-subunit alcohol dehydrogenase family)